MKFFGVFFAIFRCLLGNTIEFRLQTHIAEVPCHAVCRSVTQYDLTRRILECGDKIPQEIYWYPDRVRKTLGSISFATSFRQVHLLHGANFLKHRT